MHTYKHEFLLYTHVSICTSEIGVPRVLDLAPRLSGNDLGTLRFALQVHEAAQVLAARLRPGAQQPEHLETPFWPRNPRFLLDFGHVPGAGKAERGSTPPNIYIYYCYTHLRFKRTYLILFNHIYHGHKAYRTKPRFDAPASRIVTLPLKTRSLSLACANACSSRSSSPRPARQQIS